MSTTRETISMVVGVSLAGITMFLSLVIPYLWLSRKLGIKNGSIIAPKDYNEDDAYAFISEHIDFTATKAEISAATLLLAVTKPNFKQIQQKLLEQGILLDKDQLLKIMDADTLYLKSISR